MFGDLKQNSHKNRICVWRNVNGMLETLHQGIGPNEKIKGNCSLYLLHTWMPWKKINTKPPYEVGFGWAVDKHWCAVLSAVIWQSFGRAESSLLDRCPCMNFSPLHDWGFMYIHEVTEEYGGSITLSRPPHVPGPGHFQAVYISVLLLLYSPGPCYASLWLCLRWHHYTGISTVVLARSHSVPTVTEWCESIRSRNIILYLSGHFILLSECL